MTYAPCQSHERRARHGAPVTMTPTARARLELHDRAGAVSVRRALGGDHGRHHRGAAFETFAFLREVPIVEFLTGTEWTPLFQQQALRRAAAGRRHACWSRRSRWLVALPMGLLSAIYLSEYAPTGRAPRRQAGARDPGRRADGGLRLLRADVRHAAAAARRSGAVAGFNALSPGIVMGIMILPLVSSLVGGRDARGAARPARRRLRARRDAHADGAARGRAGGVLGHHRGVHPGRVARDRRDDDRGDRRRPAAAPDLAIRSCRSRR